LYEKKRDGKREAANGLKKGPTREPLLRRFRRVRGRAGGRFGKEGAGKKN